MFTFTMSSLRTSGRDTACHQVQSISNSVGHCRLLHGIKHLYNQNNHTPVQAPKSSRALSSDVSFIIILVFGANLMNLAHERSERTAAVDSFQAAGECLALFWSSASPSKTGCSNVLTKSVTALRHHALLPQKFPYIEFRCQSIYLSNLFFHPPFQNQPSEAFSDHSTPNLNPNIPNLRLQRLQTLVIGHPGHLRINCYS